MLIPTLPMLTLGNDIEIAVDCVTSRSAVDWSMSCCSSSVCTQHGSLYSSKGKTQHRGINIHLSLPRLEGCVRQRSGPSTLLPRLPTDRIVKVITRTDTIAAACNLGPGKDVERDLKESDILIRSLASNQTSRIIKAST